ncbi:LysR family transcriptional regulator [Mangrovicoccus ximenensis]|uniref:LysR family transcriptional regulator n=1 Tax=Mangrovicoccus ximenensis TaxID=1911570 RepID=UPI000D399643|nr:LysR family transcriptional regulator [Mangrovicoccus ximenensis]
MDLRFLESLLAVIDEGSIVAAARAQGRTPAAISQRIQVLERDLGVTLLVRHANAATPTPACLDLVADMRTLVAGGHALRRSAAPEEPAGVLRLGAAIAVAASGTVAPAVAFGVSTADVTSDGLVEALIIGGSSFNAPGALTLDAYDTLMIDTDTIAASVAVGASGSVAVSVALAVSVADNDYGSTVRAGIAGSSVDIGGALSVLAESEADVDVLGVAASVSVAASGAFSFAAGVSAAVVSNTVSGLTEAVINNASGAHSVEAGGAILVRAIEDVTVNADAGAASLAISGSYVGGSVAVSAAVADNIVTSRTRAEIYTSAVTSEGSTITVDASSQSDVDVTVAAIALSASISIGVSASGAGASAKNTSTSVIEGLVTGGSVLTAAGNVTIRADDDATIDATVVAVALSVGVVGVSVGVAIGENDIQNEVTAGASGGSITANGSGDILIDADASQTYEVISTAVSVTVALAGAAGAGVRAVNDVDSVVTAYASGTDLTASGNTVQIDADSDHHAQSTGIGVAASTGVAISVVDASASIGGATRAYADGDMSVTAASMDVTADSVAFADPDVVTVSISLGGAGSGSLVGATVDRVTEAFVGAAAGTVPAGTTEVILTGGPLAIAANSDFTATADPVTLGVSGGISVAATVTNATISGATLAYVGESTTVQASKIDVTADSTETATAKTITGAFGAGAAINFADAVSVVSSDTEAFIGAREGETPLGGQTSVTVTGGGALLVQATADRNAVSDTLGISVSAFAISVGASLPSATVSGRTSAAMDGDVVVSAGAVTVRGQAENYAYAKALAADVSIFGIGANGVNAVAEIAEGADVEAVIGSDVEITSAALLVEAKHIGAKKNTAEARSEGGSGGILGGASIMLAEATVAGGVRAQMDGDVLGSSSVTVTANGRNVAEADVLAQPADPARRSRRQAGLDRCRAGVLSAADARSFAALAARLGAAAGHWRRNGGSARSARSPGHHGGDVAAALRTSCPAAARFGRAGARPLRHPAARTCRLGGIAAVFAGDRPQCPDDRRAGLRAGICRLQRPAAAGPGGTDGSDLAAAPRRAGVP